MVLVQPLLGPVAMLTRRIDAAIQSMYACRERVPFLREQYRPGSREQVALDDVLASLKRADEVLLDFRTEAPAERA